MSITPSKEEQRRKDWTAELRSGNRKQCRGTLFDGNGYCCLGVGTDLYHEDTGLGRWLGNQSFFFEGDENGESACFPTRVHQYFGLVHSNPSFTIEFTDPDFVFEGIEEEGTLFNGWRLPDGKKDASPSMHINPTDCAGVFTSNYSLAQLNDGGFTFEQIADVVDYFFNDDTPVERESVPWNRITTPKYTTLSAQEVTK